MNIKLSNFVIDIFVFLSTLLIGADVIGIEILDVNIRLVQVFQVIALFFMLVFKKVDFKINLIMILFLISFAISSIFAFNISRSILFLFSAIFNVFIIYILYINYIRFFGINKFIKLFRITCYIQAIILCIQFAIKIFFDYDIPFLPNYGEFMGIPRFQLWFYEPSYLVTYMIFWFTLSLYMFLINNKTSYLLDVILSFCLFIVSTSTSGFIGLAMTIVLIYLLWLTKGFNKKKLIFPIVVVVLCVAVYLIFPDMVKHFVGRLFTMTLDEASGGRISAYTQTFTVFKENVLFGVGSGCYGLYLGLGTDVVPTNVTLDLLATLGIVGTVLFYAIYLKMFVDVYKLYKVNKSSHRIIAPLILGLIMFTILLQFNQGYLRLYHWMIFGMVEGAISYYKRQYLCN